MSTWSPAQEIKRPDVGHLTEGADADVTVIRVDTGTFGFLDSRLTKMTGSRKMTCELTVRNGRVVYDLNGLAADEWREHYKKFPLGMRRRPQSADRPRQNQQR